MTIIHTKMVNSLAFILVLFFTAGIGFAGTNNMEDPGSTVRSIEDYLERQGTFCILDTFAGGVYLVNRTESCEDLNDLNNTFLPQFVPPVQNMPGWTDPARGLGAFVDSAGLANDVIGFLGTTFDGEITETERADGRAIVTVELRTENALIYAVQGCVEGICDFGAGEVVFGNRPDDVIVAGAEPALGESRLVLRFKNTAPGAPIPDLLQLFFFPEPGQRLRALRFKAKAKSGGLEFRTRQVCAPNCDLDFFNIENIVIRED